MAARARARVHPSRPASLRRGKYGVEMRGGVEWSTVAPAGTTRCASRAGPDWLIARSILVSNCDWDTPFPRYLGCMRAYVPTCSRDGTASGGAKPRLGAGVGGSHDDVLTREFARSSKQVPLKAHQCGGDGREASVRFAHRGTPLSSTFRRARRSILCLCILGESQRACRSSGSHSQGVFRLSSVELCYRSRSASRAGYHFQKLRTPPPGPSELLQLIIDVL